MFDELSIYRHYIGSHYQIGKKIKSPLPGRSDDNPSFSTKMYNQRIYWKDFGYAGNFGSDVIGFVAEMEIGVSSREEALEVIKSGNYGQISNSRSYMQRMSNVSIPLTFKTKPLQLEHYDYFKSLFVPRELLHRHKYQGLVSVNKLSKNYFTSSVDNFGFFWPAGGGKKGYAPFNFYGDRPHKFWHENMRQLEGYDTLPRNGNILIAVTSMKDIVSVEACSYEYKAFCTSGEGMFSLLEKMAPELIERFPIRLVWGDNDSAGWVYNTVVSRLLKTDKVIHCDIAKDPSDIIIKTDTQFYINDAIRKVI
jgi:hypothetical protein